MGVERFGILSVIWILLGYLALFDFGLSRFVTIHSAQAIALNQRQNLSKIFWSSSLIVVFSSALVAVVLWALTYTQLISQFQVSEDFYQEALSATRWMVLAIPAVIFTTLFRSLLESDQLFKELNVLQLIAGTYNYLSPMLVIHSQTPLLHTVQLLVVGRFAICLAHGLWCLAFFPEIKAFKYFSKADYQKMLTYGGWLTISNVINPILVYIDRLFLGLFLEASKIAYYTLPTEILNRSLIVPQSIARATFPQMSVQKAGQAYRSKPYLEAQKLTMLTMLPFCLCAFIFGKYALNLWVGQAFTENCLLIFQILTVGVVFASLAGIPYLFIQSRGRSDVAAKLHMCQFPVYLIALYFSVMEFGATGAAICWTARWLVELLMMEYAAKRIHYS
jgi:O-antigen/teichoic acid export membrane protein